MILPSFRASQVGTVPGPELPCWVVAGPTQSGPYTLELGMGLLVDRLALSGPWSIVELLTMPPPGLSACPQAVAGNLCFMASRSS
jgi:hypothetical protein